MSHLSYRSLLGPLLIWIAVVAAGLIAALLRGEPIEGLGPVAVIAMLPALMSLLLTPAVARGWAQAILLLIWTGFAAFASLAAGFVPLAIAFLCVPALGMLFYRGRVVEGLLLASIAFVATFLSLAYLDAGASPWSEAQRSFFTIVTVAGTLALIVAAMIAGTQNRVGDLSLATPTGGTTRWRNGVAGGLFEFDNRDRLVGANPQGRQQFGLDGVSETVTLANLTDDASVGRLIGETATAARQAREPREARLTLSAETTQPQHYDLRFTPTRTGGLLLHTIDRTDDESRIETLRRSHTVACREAEDKTLFFAGVSHELRTPLNAIIGFSDMMRSRLFGPLPGKYAEYADLIHDSGQYMLDLIGDVLDLSKVEAGRYQLVLDTFDASDVVRSSIKMVRPAADAAEVALDVVLPDEDPLLVTADRKALRQILLNLLSNAIKFSPKGSRVRVVGRETEGRLLLSVADQGAGMSAEEIERVGEPFAQGASAQVTDARGSGLGLSLVRSLAELHGGYLEIESAAGEGTTARIGIPIQAD